MKMNVHIALAVFSLVLFGCGSSETTVTTPIDSSSTVLSSSSTVVDGSSSSTGSWVPNGYLTTTPDPTAVAVRYQEWKNAYYITVETEATYASSQVTYANWSVKSGAARIKWTPDTTYTVSEGIGYGMLNALFMSDWDAFNRLWVYYNAFVHNPTGEGGILMQWQVTTFYSGAEGSATDADLDVATALILAYEKTGSVDYLNYALRIATSIWMGEIEAGSTNLILPGNAGWDGIYNPSYFSPVALRLFAKYDGYHDWNTILETNYNWMVAINAAGSGLFPDWVDAVGTPTKPATGKANQTYNLYALESVRIPWRLAWDYYWYGEPRAKLILDRMAAYASSVTSGNINNTRSRYSYSAVEAIGGAMGLGSSYVGSFCAVGIADPNFQDWTNTCTALYSSQAIIGAVNYYDNILEVLYSLFLNGMFVKPGV